MHTGIEGDFLTRVENIKTSLVRGNLAVHKPLLLLLALGRVQRQERPLTPFNVIAGELSALLEKYWTQKGDPEVLDPFWRLQSDELWKVVCEHEKKLEFKKGRENEPTLTSLREADARGGFLEHYDSQLRQRPDLIESAARHLLSRYFPEHPPHEVASAARLTLR
jgi:putative restriction endonuclease